ncbi:Large ribosomal subunit protein [Trichinella pseudospiralis]|nr:hypothetical protein T4E_9430 [Trichinella pseudospiralis]
MSSTRNGKFLSLEQKLEVCKLVESDIRHSGPQLKNFVSHMNTWSSRSSRKWMEKRQTTHLIQRKKH